MPVGGNGDREWFEELAASRYRQGQFIQFETNH
jgi:hypothetical protein